jgi:Protein of unknown function (DUF2510)
MPSGWFPDPYGRHDYRFFNGTAWTADVSDDGQRYVDPYGAAPRVPGAAAGPIGPPPSPGNGAATAAITCGLIGLFFAWMPVFVVIGIALGVLALVFGVRGVQRAGAGAGGRSRAVAGVVAGGLALALSVVGIVLSVTLIREFRGFLDPGRLTAEVLDCRVTSTGIQIDGQIQNLESEPHDYTVYAVMTYPSIDDLVLRVDDVAPEEVRAFTIERIVSTADDTCAARFVVHGPTPYDLEMDRIDD